MSSNARAGIPRSTWGHVPRNTAAGTAYFASVGSHQPSTSSETENNWRTQASSRIVDVQVGKNINVAENHDSVVAGKFETLTLPLLNAYPLPPTCQTSDSEEVKRRQLLLLFREFAEHLFHGIYLEQYDLQNDDTVVE